MKAKSLFKHKAKMTWLAPKVLCAFAHNVNHFQMLIQIGGNCIYSGLRVDCGADLKGSRLREFSISSKLLGYAAQPEVQFCCMPFCYNGFVPQYSFKIYS